MSELLADYRASLILSTVPGFWIQSNCYEMLHELRSCHGLRRDRPRHPRSGAASGRIGHLGRHSRRIGDGPHATRDEEERARRQDRLQWAASTWDALPFDAESTRVYGRIFVATKSAGRFSRARLADLLIASTAAANGLPLYTRNPSDLVALEAIITVIAM